VTKSNSSGKNDLICSWFFFSILRCFVFNLLVYFEYTLIIDWKIDITLYSQSVLHAQF